ncbi:MAG: flagellar hook-associated protein FlgK, partial [Pseudomonadota bacterium]
MADLLSNSVSALLAFRRAIDVTSHNIANVDTPGYSRQRAELVSRGGPPSIHGYVGDGVRVATVRRLYDDIVAAQVRTTASGYRNLEVFASYAERLSDLFGDSETGLSATLQRFVNALQDIADTPTSIPARQVLLGEVETLRDRLQHIDGRLRALETEIESRLRMEAIDITSIAAAIAQLNRDIEAETARTGQPPNDLLDRRDRLIDDLSGRLNVTVVPTGRAMVSVFVGTGQPLVLGAESMKLSTRPDDFDPTRSVLVIERQDGASDITRALTGGSLGGLLTFRSELLDPARNSVGRIAVALADVVNEQHRAGMDLTGALGTDLFAVGSVDVLAHALNSGSASVTATRSDISALTEHDYVLRRTASGWELLRTDTGEPVTLTGSGSAADPLVADGLTIVVDGNAATGDEFLIRPTREAVRGFDVLIHDPERIAAAMPIRSTADPGNVGTDTISELAVTDRDHPQLLAPVTIEFLTPTTYSINGSGSFAYTPGEPIEMNGWRIAISGAPEAGDRF